MHGFSKESLIGLDQSHAADLPPPSLRLRFILRLVACRVWPSAGKELQSKAEKEAAEKYQAGLELLQELEANDKKRAVGA